jgi:signal transduction histidine kinase
MQDSFSERTQILRMAAWLWLAYLVFMLGMDWLNYFYRPVPLPRAVLLPLYHYHASNGVLALIFFGLVYTSWIRTRVHSFFLPMMIGLMAVMPVLLSHIFNLQLPPGPLANVEGMILRQLPVLLIGLVLIAWHYNLAIMLGYSLGVNLFDLLLINRPETIKIAGQLNAIYLTILIRTFSFVMIGVFISHLIVRLRRQQTALQVANQEMTHHASTLENLAVSRERNRLARELHDTLAHSLTALAVQLETVKAYWEVDTATAQQLLEQALAATRSGLDETRRTLKELRASPLEDLGLPLALQKLAESAAERGRLELDLTLPEDALLLSPDVEQCIYRVAQEAVTNVVHHANAHRLTLSLLLDPNVSPPNDLIAISLKVADDGVGISSATTETAALAGHFGLKGMRERAQLAGGVLRVCSQPGQGTCIELEIKGYAHYESGHL